MKPTRKTRRTRRALPLVAKATSEPDMWNGNNAWDGTHPHPVPPPVATSASGPFCVNNGCPRAGGGSRGSAGCCLSSGLASGSGAPRAEPPPAFPPVWHAAPAPPPPYSSASSSSFLSGKSTSPPSSTSGAGGMPGGVGAAPLGETRTPGTSVVLGTWHTPAAARSTHTAGRSSRAAGAAGSTPAARSVVQESTRMTRRMRAALMRGTGDRSRDNTYDTQSACSSNAGRQGEL